MAGDWIKMRCDLAEDPAVIAMAARLNIEDDAVVGKLHRLWSWADRQSRDGHAAGVTTFWIDRYVHCDGFASAMECVAWLVLDQGGVIFPNFDRHNGKPAKQRALGTVRQQNRRSGVTLPVTQQAPDVSRNERDKSVTREEKRREEINTPLPPKGGKRRGARSVAQEPAGFGRFWVEWPAGKRKESRGKCVEAWVSKGLEAIADEIVAHVIAKRDGTDWAHDAGQYVEAPLVYLNQRRWEGAQIAPAVRHERGLVL